MKSLKRKAENKIRLEDKETLNHVWDRQRKSFYSIRKKTRREFRFTNSKKVYMYTVVNKIMETARNFKQIYFNIMFGQ